MVDLKPGIWQQQTNQTGIKYLSPSDIYISVVSDFCVLSNSKYSPVMGYLLLDTTLSYNMQVIFLKFKNCKYDNFCLALVKLYSVIFCLFY